MEQHVLELSEIPGMNLRAPVGAMSENPHSTSLQAIASPARAGQGKGMGGRENLLELTSRRPYRKPTQVGGHKCAKVYERTRV